MTLKHAAAIILICALIVSAPMMLWVWITRETNLYLLPSMVLSSLIFYPLIVTFADMASTALKGADDG